jgi:two-component system chemotaxis response regulator CheB
VEAVTLGGSAGGMAALRAVLGVLPADFPTPILVVSHLHPTDGGLFVLHLGEDLALPVCEARDKQPAAPSQVYVAPAGYHLLVERDRTLALSADARVNWSRPSIDVLFESAARVWTTGLICVVLSGANDDGAEGAWFVKQMGGLAVAQNPATAEQPIMPRAAIARAGIDIVLSPPDIARFLLQQARPARPDAPEEAP